MTRLILALMWLLHWLPLPLLVWVGRGLGLLLYAVVGERRRVTLTNLGLCFPQLSAGQKSALARRHFMAFGRSIVELGLWWWASPARIRRLVRLEGGERLAEYKGKPVILLVPHFVGIDAGWIRMALEQGLVAIYTRQKNRVFEAAMNGGRLRFGNCELASRQEGTRKALKAMKAGRFFHYSPDMDYGPRESVFVPFFGVQTATITGLSRLAKLTGATVIPVITRMEANAYVARVGEPWTAYPGDDDVADARRLNAFIEAEVERSPEQYYWLHKRFKTRPAGEARFY
ncbi:MAG: lipid A biosynthesis acyltransferase [Sulfuritalea sp.]|jgi:KDO2-lipid IV(A) lauroyltransferase|nr:lipid A biosynthesis acyltransferase [Sulfuritalea sp.]MBK9349185.1 lipid A biosynthesis acyltransferase [Sulfuritalea sp.]